VVRGEAQNPHHQHEPADHDGASIPAHASTTDSKKGARGAPSSQSHPGKTNTRPECHTKM